LGEKLREVLKAGLVAMVLGGSVSEAWGTPEEKVEPMARGTVGPDGAVQVPAFTLPFSDLASPEARDAFVKSANKPFVMPNMKDIQAVRAAADESSRAQIARSRERYAVKLEPQTIGGVSTVVVTPADGVDPKNKNRVLINLHGSGWILWGRVSAPVEAIPIASVGKIKVVSIDYRLAPEYKFPAASEDVAAVYKELLKTYKPADIGIYGCSAGGKLTAQSVAWFQAHDLPNPGVIGVFCASLGPPVGGDSIWISSAIGGRLMAAKGAPASASVGPYLAGVPLDNPLAYPEASPALLAKFPPTLFVTGTRALELSTAVHSHIQLLKAGVDAELAVWDGVDHGFWINPDLPESREAYDVIVKFFDRHLGR
jgi:acetyl esterase/lipase